MVNIVLVLTVLTGLVNSVSISDCPSSIPRDRFLQVHGDSCFQYVLEHYRDFSPAEQDCVSRGGTLVIVNSQEIQNYIFGQLQTSYWNDFDYDEEVWIGLHDEKQENVYEWEDGSVSSYSNWGQNEGPKHNGASEDCVTMHTDTGKWKDHVCESDSFSGLFPLQNAEYPYICQYKVNTSSTAVTTQECPASVPRDSYLQVFNNQCFHFVFASLLNYTGAEAFCEKRGGTLVIVSSQAMQTYIFHELQTTYYYEFDYDEEVWIGLHDEQTENVYEWEDGTISQYTNWGANEGPQHNGATEDCVTMHTDTGKWRDHACVSQGTFFLTSVKYPFICQYNLRSVTTVAPAATSTTEAPTTKNITEAGTSTTRTATPTAAPTTTATTPTSAATKTTTAATTTTPPPTMTTITLTATRTTPKTTTTTTTTATATTTMTTTTAPLPTTTSATPTTTTATTAITEAPRTTTTPEGPPTTEPSATADCPASISRDRFLQVHRDSCFQFLLEEKRDFISADQNCSSGGGTLAIVSSQDIQDYIFAQLRTTYYLDFDYNEEIWIGLGDEERENTYEWEDGTVSNYSNWATNEGPGHNGASEDCVTMHTQSGQWKDHDCSQITRYPYICQYKLRTTTATATAANV